MDGYLIKSGHPGVFRHQLGGKSWYSGDDCPNCGGRLTLFAVLDATDPRIGLSGLGLQRIPIFDCLRCELMSGDLTYQIVDDGAIRLCMWTEGQPDYADDWEQIFGLGELERHGITLTAVPKRIQDLYKKHNEARPLTESEELEIAKFTGNFASFELGAYPVVDAVNQVGGDTLLIQGRMSPQCRLCSADRDEKMEFLLSLTNDDAEGIRLMYPGYQLVAFICRPCRSISVWVLTT